MSAATSIRSSATWSRSASAWSASAAARKSPAKAELAAEERVLTALVGAVRQPGDARESSARSSATASSTTRRSRSRSRDTGARHAAVRHPRQPGGSVGVMNIGEMLGKAFGGRTKTRRVTVEDSHEPAGQRGIRQAARQRGGDARGDRRGRERRHRLPRRDRQDLRARGPLRRRRQPRGRAARPAAADRGHDGRDQVRAGEDRPHPVHRLGRLPRRQAVGPAARAAGPPADPRRAAAADQGGLPPHPDRDRGEPDQAVHRADGDRGRDAGVHRRRHRRDRLDSPWRSTPASRTSAPGGCRR